MSKTHREIVLQAEITARNAANVEYRGMIDVLEEGLREAKHKIAELQRLLRLKQQADAISAVAPGATVITVNEDG